MADKVGGSNIRTIQPSSSQRVTQTELEFRLMGDGTTIEKGTAMRRIVTVLAILALVACGAVTGSPEPTEQSHATNVVSPTTTTLWATPTSQVPVETTSTNAPGTTTTATPAPSTTTSAGTTSTAAVATMQVAPYFYVDEAGHAERTGPFVVPIARDVPKTVAPARAAMGQLLAGPTSDERRGTPAISTAIPSGTRLLGLTIDEDIATVDFSAEFGATDEAAAVAQRAAQVVFTLSRFDSVSEVLFRQEGKPVLIQTGDGSLVSRPVGIWDYMELAAAITVESPVYGGQARNPMRVIGFGAVFEAAFHYSLSDAKGLILEEGIAMTNNGTGWGGFDFTVDYEIDQRQPGSLIVWANSAKDGSQIDVREYPVVLIP